VALIRAASCPTMAGPLVLLHGFTQTRSSWRPVIAALDGRVHAVAPDMPGHGSAAARPASFPACVGYVRALGGERFSLCGYSMGGRIALAAALALAPRVERLVLVGASPGIGSDAEREARRASDEALAARIEAIGVAAFASEWAAQPLFAGQPPQVAAAAHEDRLRNTAAGLASALRGLGTGAMEPLWDRLGELTIPVTLVAGARDEKFRAIAARMGEALPRGRVEIVEGAGHAVQLERPDTVAALLAS
jgi:2-succinyl-6-hydroxy-2,4-cyclohexadiene-1-carboxylate synthase